MAATLLGLVDKHDYQKLFLEHLRWSRPDQQPITVPLDGRGKYHIANVSSYKGLRVWVCPELPNSSDQAAVDRAIAKTSTDRLLIFHDETKQVWRWPVRTLKAGSVTTRLTSHVHVTGMENPKLLRRLQAITLGITESLSATDVIERVKRAFDVETEKETKRASKLMASMFDALKKAGTPEHGISVTLARTLFLMFGDDTDMWDKDLFQKFIIDHTRPDGSDLADRLNELFIYLDTPEDRDATPKHLAGFKYVNGGLFRERITLPPIGPELRTAILDATSSDWSDISPAIFGSMFQSVRDAKTRREFGEHYTSEKDILRTLNPLFLDELREEYAKAVDHREETALLTKLRERLARIRFLDPACGCGNFIIIAYRELRLLEIAILERLKLKESQRNSKVDASQLEIAIGTADNRQGRGKTTFLDPKVVLDNFFGIEIDEWPAKIAETAMFLMDRQCDLQMIERLGYAPERLPIQRQATIVTATEDNLGRGNSLRFEWSDLFRPDDDTIVAGNPPYAGQSLRTDEQTADLQLAWGNDYDGYLDYVTGWHAKAITFLSSTTGARFAYVTTNSIAQGQPVPALFGPIFRDGWRIRFAHRTFPWESEASGKAAVHCVIVGFDRGGPRPQLWDYSGGKGAVQHNEVPFINAYLVDGPNVLVRKRSKPLTPSLPEVNYGSKPVDGGFLVVKKPEYDHVVADPIAAKYLRSFIGADELIGGTDRWCLWLVDATEADIEASPILLERVERVRQMRLASTKAATRTQAATPHIFSEIRQPKRPYLCIPSVVSENRAYLTTARMKPEVITSNLAFTAPDEDGFLFALISSSIFMDWQRLVGGRLKSDYRFSNTIVWNNFPLGHTDPGPRKVIVDAGSRVLAARAKHPGASLESLYDPSAMPEDLLAAHLALDKEVDSFFGIPVEALELDRQRLLLERYVRYALR
ncbi:hypothetical protein FBY31_4373 [Arthrobacter sp. SLBN-100]|uniref:class I SAM-dependent DNA methyltransferase n=1 Tax=Arthrobacter sp. SLBN-100 TaxID=2768450 RepID=UPI0011521750|nr:DNA methyltransferase [Arthrobacter sp. SLBN-100]TQJ61999.1 hypothetical protein FBY31_4373 [Arthrobacter sp. SLBN-100]